MSSSAITPHLPDELWAKIFKDAVTYRFFPISAGSHKIILEKLKAIALIKGSAWMEEVLKYYYANNVFYVTVPSLRSPGQTTLPAFVHRVQNLLLEEMPPRPTLMTLNRPIPQRVKVNIGVSWANRTGPASYLRTEWMDRFSSLESLILSIP